MHKSPYHSWAEPYKIKMVELLKMTSPQQRKKALKEAVRTGKWSLPLVQKTRSEGYDGKGVAIIRTLEDMASKLLPGACLAEDA